MIRLFDTIHGEVRELQLRDAGKVSMYVCGPTVYDLPHLGHGRFTLVWDVARRWFSFQGLDVKFVSNITDIDDNIINRANREGTTEEVWRQRTRTTGGTQCALLELLDLTKCHTPRSM